MKFRYKVGTIIPWYMGFLKYDPMRNEYLVAPIPFNIILSIVVELWYHVRIFRSQAHNFNEKRISNGNNPRR